MVFGATQKRKIEATSSNETDLSVKPIKSEMALLDKNGVLREFPSKGSGTSFNKLSVGVCYPKSPLPPVLISLRAILFVIALKILIL